MSWRDKLNATPPTALGLVWCVVIVSPALLLLLHSYYVGHGLILYTALKYSWYVCLCVQEGAISPFSLQQPPASVCDPQGQEPRSCAAHASSSPPLHHMSSLQSGRKASRLRRCASTGMYEAVSSCCRKKQHKIIIHADNTNESDNVSKMAITITGNNNLSW